MLRWSGNEQGIEVNLDEIARHAAPLDEPLQRELNEFADACTDVDAQRLADARSALVRAADAAVMVDAAAVVANFEMMTRLADGTGARMPEAGLQANAAIVAAFGMDDAVSKR
jgi:hypothetical protein